MSHRTYCDRCGREATGPVQIHARIQLAEVEPRDLCAACVRDLVAWLDAGAAEHEQGHR